ncbi:hypothetical protein BJ138DRAFT_1183339 [Hygrophoropsis aurantiaca]|uniref:Uncharacterized protein n=1 Tax=Hygrophoropsis aurantiaca TaxID=72124 RepID=A0ACB8A096_9AGAM|nr:hypothetical protein BJ138DRAFT_1183339 [Hygrophoropsis aurantiaca]
MNPRCYSSLRALSFWSTSGPTDQAQEWAARDNAIRASSNSSYSDAGISFMVSASSPNDQCERSCCVHDSKSSALMALTARNDTEALLAAQAFPTALRAKRQAQPQGDYILTHASAFGYYSSLVNNMATHRTRHILIILANHQYYSERTSRFLANSTTIRISREHDQIHDLRRPTARLLVCLVRVRAVPDLRFRCCAEQTHHWQARNDHGRDQGHFFGCVGRTHEQRRDALIPPSPITQCISHRPDGIAISPIDVGVIVWVATTQHPDVAGSWIQQISRAFPE